MEWTRYGMRYGPGTLPNVNFTVPRRSDVSYLKACGYTKTRLPIQWEMLQPMLQDTPANAAARDAIGQPGAFHAGYASYITGVLDAHAAVGTSCIIDLHNFCRYQDFLFQSGRLGHWSGQARQSAAVCLHQRQHARCKCASSRWRRARR